MSARTSARLLGLLPALLLTGCVPGVGWMPDSSGFVYTAGPKGDQLRFFDLKSGQARVGCDRRKWVRNSGFRGTLGARREIRTDPLAQHQDGSHVEPGLFHPFSARFRP